MAKSILYLLSSVNWIYRRGYKKLWKYIHYRGMYIYSILTSPSREEEKNEKLENGEKKEKRGKEKREKKKKKRDK